MTFEEWKQHNRNWRASGLKQEEYCKNQKISWHVFRDRGRSARKLESSSNFVKVELPKNSESKKLFEIGFCSDGKFFIHLNLEIML
jgi:hypothetical protein